MNWSRRFCQNIKNGGLASAFSLQLRFNPDPVYYHFFCVVVPASAPSREPSCQNPSGSHLCQAAIIGWLFLSLARHRPLLQTGDSPSWEAERGRKRWNLQARVSSV